MNLPGPILKLSAGTLVLAVASAFIWPLNTIYVHHVMGRSLTTAGLVLLLQSGSGLVTSILGGHLYDRWGGRRTVVLGAGIAACAAMGLGLFHAFTGYVLMMALMGSGSGLIYPAMNAMAGSAWAAGGRRAFNALYVAQNIGVAVGTSIGGLLAERGFVYAFLGNAVVVAMFGAFAWRMFREEAWRESAPVATVAAARAAAGQRGRELRLETARRPWRDPGLILLASGLLLATAAYSQWTTTVATHLQALGFSIPQYSVLWTINGAVILLGQPLISALTRRIPDVSRQILVGTGAYVVVFLLLIHDRDYAGFVGLMVLLTLGEMLVWPGVPAAADRLASEGNRGAYQGLVSGATSAGRMTGPLVGGLIYDAASPADVFIVMTLVMAAAWAVFAVAGCVDRAARVSDGVDVEPVARQAGAGSGHVTAEGGNR